MSLAHKGILPVSCPEEIEIDRGPRKGKTSYHRPLCTVFKKSGRSIDGPSMSGTTFLQHVHGEGGDGAGHDQHVHDVPQLPEVGSRVQNDAVVNNLKKIVLLNSCSAKPGKRARSHF